MIKRPGLRTEEEWRGTKAKPFPLYTIRDRRSASCGDSRSKLVLPLGSLCVDLRRLPSSVGLLSRLLPCAFVGATRVHNVEMPNGPVGVRHSDFPKSDLSELAVSPYLLCAPPA